MIKFFRNIRQNLLNEGKTSKYLKYAIGEILLVVVGILIALNINNWNEQKKQEAKIIKILKEIQNDIQTDLVQANRIFDYQLHTDSISKGVFNNKFTAEDYRSGSVQKLGYHYRDFKIVTNGYDNLKGNIDNVPDAYAELLPAIKNLYTGLKVDIDVYNDRIRNNVYRNIDESYGFDWSQDDLKSIVSDAEIDYYLNNKDYKDLVGNYMNDRNNIFRKSNEYRVTAKDLYLKIHKAIDSKDAIPDSVNYTYKNASSTQDFVGTYRLKESSNLDDWDKTFSITESDGQLKLLSSGPDLNLLYYNQNTFFADFYYVFVVFNRPQNGRFYITGGKNNYAIYEKTNSK